MGCLVETTGCVECGSSGGSNFTLTTVRLAWNNCFLFGAKSASVCRLFIKFWRYGAVQSSLGMFRHYISAYLKFVCVTTSAYIYWLLGLFEYLLVHVMTCTCSENTCVHVDKYIFRLFMYLLAWVSLWIIFLWTPVTPVYFPGFWEAVQVHQIQFMIPSSPGSTAFFKSRARSKNLFIFSDSFFFVLWSFGMAKSIRWPALSSCYYQVWYYHYLFIYLFYILLPSRLGL